MVPLRRRASEGDGDLSAAASSGDDVLKVAGRMERGGRCPLMPRAAPSPPSRARAGRPAPARTQGTEAGACVTRDPARAAAEKTRATIPTGTDRARTALAMHAMSAAATSRVDTALPQGPRPEGSGQLIQQASRAKPTRASGTQRFSGITLSALSR